MAHYIDDIMPTAHSKQKGPSTLDLFVECACERVGNISYKNLGVLYLEEIPWGLVVWNMVWCPLLSKE